MNSVGLISCAASKLDRAAPAQALYTSVLFRKCREYAVRHCDAWFILSAKHGLLRPDEVIEPYDITLNSMPSTERRAWAERIWSALSSQLPSGARVIVLAGQRYREHLVPRMEQRGCHVEVPLLGMRIGEQLRWLTRQLDD